MRGDLVVDKATVDALIADYLAKPVVSGKIKADSVTSGTTVVRGIDVDLKRDGGSTQWLVNTIWKTGQQLGYSKNFLNEDTGISDDHIPFLEARIPAIDLIDFNYGPDHSYWHKLADSLDKVSGESIKIVCDTVITALPEIFKQLDSRTGAARSN